MSVFNPGSLTAENNPFNSKGPFLGERGEREFEYVCVYIYPCRGMVSPEEFADIVNQVTVSRGSALL